MATEAYPLKKHKAPRDAALRSKKKKDNKSRSDSISG